MAGPRPRRRPALFVAAAAVVTVIVLLAQGAASTHTSTGQAVQSYFDQVRPEVDRSAAEGADFADLRANAAALGRDGIDRRLSRLGAEVQATLASVESLTPPASLRVAQAYLVAALGVRDKAVREARPAMGAALTVETSIDQGVPQAVDQLRTVGRDLGLGDRAIALFVGALPAGSGITPGAPWVSDAGQWDGVTLTALVDLLRSSASARPVHDLAMLAFQTDPAAVTIGTDGTQTIPALSTTSVSMVVENVGNRPEQNLTVMVILTVPGGAPETLRDFIDLGPGQTRALTLRPLPTKPGMAGKLVVEVFPVPGETDLANNSITTSVVFR